MTLRVLSVVGARPQFIKAAALSLSHRITNAGEEGAAIKQTLVHTGQHYDFELSEVFFQDLLGLRPAFNLGVGSGGHGYQTGQILSRLEPLLTQDGPDVVVVFGDTNSTLAGALAAAKMGLPVAHVEAGLRSFNWKMPEEINRVVTDRLSTALYCPSKLAVKNLAAEGIEAGVCLAGDLMQDIMRFELVRAQHSNLREEATDLLGDYGVERGQYFIATVHRAENTDDPERLISILKGLEALAADEVPVLMPLHPRTRDAMAQHGLTCSLIRTFPPVSYGCMLLLQRDAKAVLTDSGGIQKEAYWLGVPCLTLREETEWQETVDAGWNTLVGTDPELITRHALEMSVPSDHPPLYGDGYAARTIVDDLLRRFGKT